MCIGICVRNQLTGEVFFISKGAEAVMMNLLASSASSSSSSSSTPSPAIDIKQDLSSSSSSSSSTDLVPSAEWLEEELSTLARSGLRTLVYAYRRIPPSTADGLVDRLNTAMAALTDRDGAVNAARSGFEKNLVILGATAVEDALQYNVRQSLETIRNAAIKVRRG